MTESTITHSTTTVTPGAALISALVAGDADAARALLAPDVGFNALVPTKLIEKSGREETLAVLRDWFPEDAVWLDHIESGTVGSRQRVGYRVRWESPEDGLQIFEQQAYYDADASGITWMHLVCSGDHPLGPG